MADDKKQGPGMIAAIAGGIGFAVFLLLMALLGLSFSPAILLGIVVAIGVWLYFQKSRGEGTARGAQTREVGAEDTRAGYSGAAPVASGAQAGLDKEADGRSDDAMSDATDPNLSPTRDDSATGTAATVIHDAEHTDGTQENSASGLPIADDGSATTAGAADTSDNDRDSKTGGDNSVSGATGRDSVESGLSRDESAVGATEAVENASVGYRDDKSVIRPSKPLAGQAELAERKGSWKYEKGGAPVGAAAALDAVAVRETEDGSASDPDRADASSSDAPRDDGETTKTADQTAAGGSEEGRAALPANGTADIDGTAVVGSEPERLSAPRDGGPDDLKRIKGVGPKLEDMLNRMGFYHYDQIAAWTDREIAWVDANLDGFKGRVSRDEWVSQARSLSNGDDPAAPQGANV